VRFLLSICVALVVGLTPALAQDATQSETPARAAEASVPQPGTWLPPTRVGQVRLISGNVDLRRSDEAGWTDAEPNQPVFAGESLRTDARARTEIQIGPNTIDLFNATEIRLAILREHFTQITISRGRIELHLRQFGDGEAVEIDFPQGGVRLLGPGVYDIDAGGGDAVSRVAVFEGTAHVVGAGSDTRIKAGQMAVLAVSEAAAAPLQPAAPDIFAERSRERDYDMTRLAASYYVSPHMTGFAELDTAGIWKVNSNYGPVWFPTDPEWAPYRFGHWNWIAPWGWTWIDDHPWGFAPSHYGRWVIIDEHWAWVPGSFVARPLYAPAVVAFLGTPGVGLSSEDGATVAWFPLAPNEVYWPGYTRDVNYVRRLNLGNIEDVEAIGVQSDGEPPLELFNEDFANRGLATVIPRSVFINGRSVAPARVTLPEQRLQNAPVLMASPQISPPSARRVAQAVNKPANAPPDRMIVRVARNKGGKPVRAASTQSPGRGQPMVIRGAHLHAPSYAGSPGRKVIVLRVSHTSRGGAGRGARP
jgi:hypothetical protein